MKVVHPAYSLDVTPSNFFLFGHLKREMARFTVTSPEDIHSEIRQIFEEIPKAILASVHNE
jgi:hypothetical protein